MVNKESTNIIGLCGRGHSGKTMLANYLVENKGYKRIYFAQALKDLCSSMLHMPIDELNAKKTEVSTYIISDKDMEFMSKETGIPLENIQSEFSTINNTLTTVRQALQFIGTDILRKYNPNWHVERTLANILPKEKYVVDDVRFDNEVEALKFHGAMLIFIVRPTFQNVTHHPSEETLKWQDFNHVIVNSSNEETAIQQLLSLIKTQDNEYFDYLLAKHYQEDWLSQPEVTYTISKEKNGEEHLLVINEIDGTVITEYEPIADALTFEDFKFVMQKYIET